MKNKRIIFLALIALISGGCVVFPMNAVCANQSLQRDPDLEKRGGDEYGHRADRRRSAAQGQDLFAQQRVSPDSLDAGSGNIGQKCGFARA